MEREIRLFKESLRLKDEIGETVSAFSNSDGGTILVGVSDDGGVTGVDIGKNTLEELANYIKRNTDPQIFPRIEITETKDGEVILIDVAENQEKPVFFKDKAYKRVGKTNQRISTPEIRRLAMEEKKRLGWDEQFCEEAGLEDIEEDKVRWFLRRAKEERGLAIEGDVKIYGILTQLNLLQDTKLANAALLLFGKDPEHFFMQSEVKCIALPTTEFVKPYDTYQTYGGNLFEQVDKATAFTLENIKFIRQKGRIQRSEYVELCGCSPKTAYNDIRDLVKKEILIASGKGKRTYYMLCGTYIPI